MAQLINTLFDSLIEKFVDRIARRDAADGSDEEIQVAKDGLLELWRQCSASAAVTVNFGEGAQVVEPKKKAAPKKKVVEKKSEELVAEDAEDDSTVCFYKITRGKTKGEVCGKKVVAGKKVCKKHDKAEEPVFGPVAENEESISEHEDAVGCDYIATRGANKGKACGKDAVDGTTRCTKHAKKEESGDETDGKKVKIIKKKGDKWVHVDTGFVMKSNKEPIVVGKLCDDGSVTGLTEEDLAVANEMGFECEAL